MKKWLCLLLALMMLFTLCCGLTACGDDDARESVVDEEDEEEDEAEEKEEEKNEEKEEEKNEDVEDAPDEMVGDEPSQEGDSEEKPTQTPSESDAEFSLGNAVGDTYTNEFIGLSWTLPAGWVFYTEKEILELNNLIGEVVDEDFAEILKKASVIYDMYASDVKGSSANVVLEHHDALKVSMANLKASIERQIPTIVTTYENMGFTDIEVEYQQIPVGGELYDGTMLSAKMQGRVFGLVSFMYKKGEYIVNVSVGSFDTDQIFDIVQSFTVK